MTATASLRLVPAPSSFSITSSPETLVAKMFSQLPCRGVPSRPWRCAALWLEGIVQRAQLVSVEVVQHQPLSLCEGMHHLPATSSDERSPQQCAARSPRMPPASFRLTEHEQVSSAVSLVLVVISFHPTRLGPDDRSLIGHQLPGCLVETDHGMVRVVVCVVQVQHVLIRATNSPLTSGMHHSFFFHLEFVFLSIWRTVSREMLSANPIATTLSASSWIVQSACPSGASTARDGYQMCFLSAVQLAGRMSRSRALIECAVEFLLPNRVRTRPTVDALINRPLAMSRS